MLRIENFNSKVRELLKFTVLKYMLDTIYENPKLGSIFADDPDNPDSCIVSFHHLLFCGGKPTQECLHFLSDEIIAGKTTEEYEVLCLVYPDEEWREALKVLFPDRHKEFERSLYRHSLKNIDDFMRVDNVVEITPELMNSSLDNLKMITDEVVSTGTYDGMEDYLKRGIGYSVIIDNKVWGFCTSEYPSKAAAAIGIEVLEEYQKQGYARAMTGQFLKKAAQRGLSVYWECWKNNVASSNTALSCGFEKVADYPVLLVKR